MATTDCDRDQRPERGFGKMLACDLQLTDAGDDYDFAYRLYPYGRITECMGHVCGLDDRFVYKAMVSVVGRKLPDGMGIVPVSQVLRVRLGKASGAIYSLMALAAGALLVVLIAWATDKSEFCTIMSATAWICTTGGVLWYLYQRGVYNAVFECTCGKLTWRSGRVFSSREQMIAPMREIVAWAAANEIELQNDSGVDLSGQGVCPDAASMPLRR